MIALTRDAYRARPEGGDWYDEGPAEMEFVKAVSHEIWRVGGGTPDHLKLAAPQARVAFPGGQLEVFFERSPTGNPELVKTVRAASEGMIHRLRESGPA
jgi:hypothetical protein